MELLKQLYQIYSPSGYEDRMSDFIQWQLDSMGIKYKVRDKMIYWFKPRTPLVCAHQDQVSDFPVSKIRYHKKTDIIYGDGNLGADDKNGIYICLNLIERFKGQISFIFSTKEEIGGNLDGLLFDYASALDTIKYGLIFDRRNGSDIVCHKNLYGTKKFEKQLSKIGKKYGYKPARGIWSDADALSEYISCANLSCGYYGAHTETEYTKYSEVINALQYGIDIIKVLKKRYEPALYNYVKPFKPIKGGLNHGYGYDDALDAEYWTDTKRIVDINYFCPNCYQYFSEQAINPGERCPLCDCQLLIEDYKYREGGAM